MKNLSFCLVVFIAFIYVQNSSILLMFVWKYMRKRFNKLRADAIKFFEAFDTEHDIAHQDVEAIGSVVGMLGSALEGFAEANLGADFEISALQCVLKGFVDSFDYLNPITNNNINHLSEEIDKLLRMASKFQYSHDLYCSRRQQTGCEAKLNKLRCDLGVFFRLIKDSGRKAKSIVRGMNDASTALNKVFKKFTKKYQLTCGSDQPPMPNSGTLKNDVKNTYFPQMKKGSDAAAKEVSDISILCGQLIPLIDNWKYRLANSG